MEQLPPVNPPRRRRGIFMRIGCMATLVLLLVLGAFVWWRYYYTYSDGNRFGLLQKFSRRGNLFKTYEGEMILSSVKGGRDITIASEKFFFSVTDENVAKKMDDLQGDNITVHYEQKKSAAFWRGDSEYIVDSVWVEP
ncbi:MAG: hypothetical protein EOO14_09035 [Chitinophagaceae bacterium]|nr:MAG: hypothetical protein EOO14_09035 [Chitinophagaceae bacterium]